MNLQIDPADKLIWDTKVEPYIYKYYRIEDKRNKFSRPMENGFPVAKKYVDFYYKEFGLLPIGMKNSFFNLLKEKIPSDLGITVKYNIKDLRKRKKIDIKGLDLNSVLNNPKFKLRYYQGPAITAWFDNNCMGLIEGSVASGKTLMFSIITKIIDQPTLIVMGRKDLVHGTIEEFINEYGFNKEDVGIVQGNNVNERKFTVCTIQSFEKIENLDKYKLIIVDECHHVAADTYQKLLMGSQAPYRLGVSGTISCIDIVNQLKVKSFLGDIVYEIKTKELIEKGVLALPTVYSFNVTEPSIMENEYGSNWIKIETDLIANNECRNNLIADLAIHYLPYPCLIVVRRIPHGESLNALIPGSVFLNGVSEGEIRTKYRKLMDTGHADCVISTEIFGEGTNLKNLKSIVIAGAGKSPVGSRQKPGRVLRKTDTKQEAIIVDFWDMQHRILERQSEVRFRAYKKNGFILFEPFDTIDSNFPLKRIR